MSNRLAKQTLDFILKGSSGSNGVAKRKQQIQREREQKEEQEKKRLRLPDTKKGIKKIKHEMRYGRQQKAKAALEKLEKKGNPLDALYEEQQAIQDNLERNVRILQAHRLKASDSERKMRKKLLSYNKQLGDSKKASSA
ncbi:hypothetical protein BDB00DRAFT_851233 [Zychaea mexicana]|uniref:uncharacterized protein n=1 Tax=Zychaea mexicana TaxID=64656 RepID=UPI0022FE77A9|nr:uncharacterized protein BDB00DRAFT_851233 [Zychaea mexicana]KAI9485138.1 hypothetical protein BDB00DRAFT_851233 [Zychaea mexicana]